jgi:bifunctional ADP-heptose synthase (sugar kinase/adenylyltransferase)
MPAYERVRLIRELKCVDAVVESMDEDRTVCKTLTSLHPDIFAKGGDQTVGTIPEVVVCNKMGIQIVDGLGEKIQSSRHLLSDFKHQVEKIDERYLNENV